MDPKDLGGKGIEDHVTYSPLPNSNCLSFSNGDMHLPWPIIFVPLLSKPLYIHRNIAADQHTLLELS